jgi:hypothetical protein
MLEDKGPLKVVASLINNIVGLKAGSVTRMKLLIEPSCVRGLTTEMFFNNQAFRLEVSAKNFHSVMGLRLSAGEDVEGCVLVLRP